MARVETPNPRYYIGSGKAEELKVLKLASEAESVRPQQVRTPSTGVERWRRCRPRPVPPRRSS